MTLQMRIMAPSSCQLRQLGKSTYTHLPFLPQENCWHRPVCLASHQFPSILQQTF